MLHSRPNGVAGPRASADLSLSLYIHCSEESDIPSMLAIYITSFSQLDVEDYHGENALNLKKFINQVISNYLCNAISCFNLVERFSISIGLWIRHISWLVLIIRKQVH